VLTEVYILADPYLFYAYFSRENPIEIIGMEFA
jgi:hypothetical protein